MRSRCRCSMCSAIHINSRSWLRSSSTHEPSDPPHKVVKAFLYETYEGAVCRRQSLRAMQPQRFTKFHFSEAKGKCQEKTEGGSAQKSGAGLFKPRGLGLRSSRNTLRDRRSRRLGRVAQVPPQLIFSPRQPAEESSHGPGRRCSCSERDRGQPGQSNHRSAH